jgi:hypothetical protein
MYFSFMEGLVLLTGRSGEAWRELAYRRVLTNDQAYLRDMAAYRPDIAHQFLDRSISLFLRLISTVFFLFIWVNKQ